MSGRQVDGDELDPAIAALFASERARPAPPDDALARLARRGELALSVRAPNRHPLPGARASVGAATARWVAGIGLGAALGAGVDHVLTAHPTATRVVVVERAPASAAPPSPAPIVPPAPTALPVAPSPAPSPAPPDRARPGVGSAPAVASTLGAEEARLAVARTALGRGQPDAALDALAVHARRFPHGELAEERESLRVQALVLAGRGDEARARAARFARDFPRSLFRPAIEASLRSISQRTGP